MSVAVLYIFLALSSFGHSALGKSSSNLVPNKSIAKYIFIVAVNGIIASIFFWILNGFKLNLNGGLLVYALIHAIIIIVARISTLVAYRYLNVADVMILLCAGKMIMSSVTGVFLFDEKITLIKVVKMILMIIAAAFICIDERVKHKKEDGGQAKKEKKAFGFGVVILMTVMILFYSAQLVLNKYYSASTYFTEEKSFCFATNAAMFLICGIFTLFALLRSPDEIKDALPILKPRALAIVSGDTVANALATILQLILLSRVDMSMFSPISNSLNIISSVLASLLFREKLGIYSYIAVAVACVAVII